MLNFGLGLAKTIASLTGLQAKRRLTWKHVQWVLFMDCLNILTRYTKEQPNTCLITDIKAM